MKTAEFISICLYYYGREALRNPGYTILLLALFFVTHKVSTWTAWVMSL